MESPETTSSPARPPVTVIIPAYQEEGAVGAVIEGIRRDFIQASGRSPDEVEILVVDDGSRDATAERARAAGAQVIRHGENRGYGAALKTGLRHARHELIIMTDADGTYPARYFDPLLRQLDDADMAVGARRGANVHIPLARRPAKWLLTRVAVFLAAQPIPDLNSGLRAFRKSDALRFRNLYPRGFSFTTTMTLAYLSSDLVVRYLPIDYAPRTGKSKFHPILDTKNLFLTIIRSILFFNPLRVCLPVSFAFFALAAFVLFALREAQGRMYFIWQQMPEKGNVLDGTIEVLVMCGLQILLIGFLADVLARMR